MLTTLDCPSGLMSETAFVPGVEAVVFSESATDSTRCVAGFAGMTMLALLTVTLPVAVATKRLRYPGPPVSGPGSKNSGHAPPEMHRPFVHVGAVQSSVPVSVKGAAVTPLQTT